MATNLSLIEIQHLADMLKCDSFIPQPIFKTIEEKRNDKLNDIIFIVGDDKELMRNIIDTFSLKLRVDKLNKIKNKIVKN